LTLSEDTRGEPLQRVVRLWNVDRGTLVRELYRGPEGITSIAIADRSRAAIAARSQGSESAAGEPIQGSAVRRWDLASGRESTSPDGGAYLDFKNRREAVWASIESPDAQGVLTVGGNGAAIWNPPDAMSPQLVFRPHSGVTSAGFSADGKWVVTGSSDR